MQPDIEQATQFLSLIEPNPDAIHNFRMLSRGGDPRANKNLTGTLSECWREIERANEAGKDAYVVINDGGHKAAHIGRIRALFADHDHGDLNKVNASWKLCEDAAFLPHVIVESSPQKFHWYWLLETGLSVDEFRQLQKQIIGALGSDPSVHDPSRVMRLPGLLNWKYGEPHQCRIIHHAPDQPRGSAAAARAGVTRLSTLGQSSLADAASSHRDTAVAVSSSPGMVPQPETAQRQSAPSPVAVSGAVVPPPAGNLGAGFDPAAVARQASRQQLGDMISALCSIDPENSASWHAVKAAFKGFGEDWWPLFDQWSRGDYWFGTKPTKYNQVVNRRQWEHATPNDGGARPIFSIAAEGGWINSASKSAQPAHPGNVHPVSESLFYKISDYQSVDIDWLVEGLLPADAVTAIVGKSGSGKTFAALAIALAVASGIPFLGMPTKQGPVLYLCGEGRHGIRKRCEAWATHFGIPLASLPIFMSYSLPPITDAESVEYIATQATSLAAQCGAPSFIAIDTLATAFGDQDENSAKGMNLFIAGVKSIRSRFPGCTILVVHHVGYEGTRARGSSVFYAALDTELTLLEDSGRKVLRTSKQKDAEPAKDMIVDVIKQEFSEGNSSLVFVKGEDQPKLAKELIMRHIILMNMSKEQGIEHLRKSGYPMGKSVYYELQKLIRGQMNGSASSIMEGLRE